jgi:Possible hemagglutinin (DUF637)
MTGLEYLDQLKARKDVNWQAVELAHDQWSYHQEGLTPAGAALLSIAVAMATGGAGTELLGTTTAAAGGGTVTTLGGMTLATTTAAGAVTTTAMGVAINAGLASLASQAAVAMVNNQGDIGKTLDQLGQEKSIQNLVTAMVTAGALDKLGKSDWLTFDGHKLSEIGLQPGQVQDFSANLFKNAVNATSSAALSAMVSGKPFDENSLADALGSALVTTSTAFGAKGIGDAKDSGDLNTFTHKLAHAVLGCAGGAATQGNATGCSPGAVGAVVGELAAEYYNPTGNPAKAAETVNFAKLMSALAGVIATGDGSNAQAVNTAAAMGANAAENNYLSHVENESRLVAARACEAGDAKACNTRDAWDELDKKRDAQLRAACYADGASAECSARYADMKVALDSYAGKTTASINKDLAIGLDRYTASSEKESFKNLLNVPHYDAKAIAKAADAIRFLTNLALDNTPIVGDVKAFAEAETRFEYAMAAITLIPGTDSVRTLLKEAKVLQDAGQGAAAAEKLAEANRGLINESNRLIKNYVDDIEKQTGYRLSQAQRTELAEQMRKGENAVNLSPAQNATLRNEFNNVRKDLIVEWEAKTGQKWPQVSVTRNGQVTTQNAPAHHVIPVKNNGPTEWWNITPANQTQHTAIHKGPLKDLQSQVSK